MTKKHKLRRLWPLGLLAAGAGAAATVLLRGCWHRHMSWPTRYDGEISYRVCTECGIKRLFDEQEFRDYGPYDFDIKRLIAKARARHQREMKKAG